ncbi:MAG TPA: hypothetical protein VMZ05_07475 [Spirochaetota bacterium]|nr:hypothetical protein [Spirochaetota bacterium]
MKTRTLPSILILVLTALICVGSCATKRIAVSHEDVIQKLDGTWINPDNPVGGTYVDLTQDATDTADFFHFQKFVLTSDNEWYFYQSLNDPMAFASGPYTIMDSWSDRKGNVYCQIFLDRRSMSKCFTLLKINKSGTVLEQSYYYGGNNKYPEKIIPHDIIVDDFRSSDVSMYYNIFYRQ